MSEAADFDIQFLDSGREPQCEPDKNYLAGRYIDLSEPGSKGCLGDIPYPSPRCGAVIVECRRCHKKAYITVAGRVDDPRRVRMECGVVLGSSLTNF